MFYSSFDQERLYYQVPLQPKNPQATIVIVHGYGGDPNFLMPLVKRLNRELPNHRIVLYDLRGHGRSTKSFRQAKDSIETTHAHDLQHLCWYLKLKQPILIGHSLGGIVVQEYLKLKLKPKPSQGVLVCTMTKMTGAGWPRQFFFDLVKKHRFLDKSIKSKPVRFHLQFKNGADLDFKRLHSDTQRVGGIKNWLLMMAALLGYENLQMSTLNHQNILYVYGTRDWLVNTAQELKRLKKYHQLIKKSLNSNHITPITNTSALATLISDFLKHQS